MYSTFYLCIRRGSLLITTFLHLLTFSLFTWRVLRFYIIKIKTVFIHLSTPRYLPSRVTCSVNLLRYSPTYMFTWRALLFGSDRSKTVHSPALSNLIHLYIHLGLLIVTAFIHLVTHSPGEFHCLAVIGSRHCSLCTQLCSPQKEYIRSPLH